MSEVKCTMHAPYSTYHRIDGIDYYNLIFSTKFYRSDRASLAYAKALACAEMNRYWENPVDITDDSGLRRIGFLSLTNDWKV